MRSLLLGRLDVPVDHLDRALELLGRAELHDLRACVEDGGVARRREVGVAGLEGLFVIAVLKSHLVAYEDRRAAIVDEANPIGTTYLRAQTLMEPSRSRSLALLRRYTDSAIRLSDYVPGSSEERAAAANEQGIQRDLWALAAQGLDARPDAQRPAPLRRDAERDDDAQTVRLAALNNRVPNAVLVLEVVGAALALALLAAFLAIVGRGVTAVSIASVLVAFLLFVTCDLDRPTRGMTGVPDTVLTSQRVSMELPPAAGAPAER